MVGVVPERRAGRAGGWLAWLLALALVLAAILPSGAGYPAGPAEAGDLCSQSHGDPAAPPSDTVAHDCCWGLCAPGTLAPPPESPSWQAPMAVGQAAYRPQPLLMAPLPWLTAHRPRGPPTAAVRSLRA